MAVPGHAGFVAGLAITALAILSGAALAQEKTTPKEPVQASSDLGLADLAAYRAAIDGKPAGEAVTVTFRALWDHPDRFQGHRVRVEGRVQRRFRQGAYGTFPPLVEAWAVSPAGDPFCLIFPDPPSGPVNETCEPGALVVFEGVFLRQLRYRGSDSARLAPLIVGNRVPTVTSAAPPRPQPQPAGAAPHGFTAVEWSLGAGAAVLVVLVLVIQYVRRPLPRVLHTESGLVPPPDFVDPA